MAASPNEGVTHALIQKKQQLLRQSQKEENKEITHQQGNSYITSPEHLNQYLNREDTTNGRIPPDLDDHPRTKMLNQTTAARTTLIHEAWRLAVAIKAAIWTARMKKRDDKDRLPQPLGN